MNRPPTAHPWVLSFWRVPCWLALVVLGLDQWTKFLVDRAWPQGTSQPPVTLIPGFFSLVHYRNKGAAWGILSNHTFLLALVSLVVFVAMVAYFRRLTEDVPERALALGVVLGGVAGNLLDRLFREGVVDFLLFYWRDWRTHSFPAFNVADSAITCGIAVYIVSSFLRGDLSPDMRPKAVPDSDA
jgi:signal peptidase II